MDEAEVKAVLWRIRVEKAVQEVFWAFGSANNIEELRFVDKEFKRSGITLSIGDRPDAEK